jgi:hypothetical protein
VLGAHSILLVGWPERWQRATMPVTEYIATLKIGHASNGVIPLTARLQEQK